MPLIVPDIDKYYPGVERTSWHEGFLRVWRWKPMTYRQVWLYAVCGFGVPGFMIMSVIFSVEGQLSWLTGALIYAVLATFFNGVLQSRQLTRRRQQGR